MPERIRQAPIDQVAAAKPELCFDPTHGHPLGGGHWWNDAYRTLIETVRARIPPTAILTTECNSEPFIADFDAFLTWHWQFQNHVPAFQAAYGSAIPIFGRSFRQGPTFTSSLCMKAAQQLVFGEQIGWVEDSGIVDAPENIRILQRFARLRRQISHYFAEGEMLRPRHPVAPMPKVRGDWRWPDEW